MNPDSQTSDVHLPVHNAAVSKVAERYSDGKYSQLDFQLSGTDTKGHSEREWFRCMPQLSRQMEAVVASKHFPFRSTGDLMRWSMMIGMKVLEELEPDMPSASRQIDLINELVRDERSRIEIESMFTKVGELVADHMSNNRPGEVKELLARTWAMIFQMPECLWRTRYMARFQNQFAAYLVRDESANFMDVRIDVAEDEDDDGQGGK